MSAVVMAVSWTSCLGALDGEHGLCSLVAVWLFSFDAVIMKAAVLATVDLEC
jgi:hypothetical protein